MMKTLLVSIIIIITMQIGVNAQERVSIIPEPKHIEIVDGSFELTSKTKLVVEHEGLSENSMLYLKDYLDKYYGMSLSSSLKGGKSNIIFRVTNDGGKDGEYRIDVNEKQIIISGSNEVGLFYGVQTLIQLLPTSGGSSLEIPCIKVHDEPQFEYRGMHLDVVRHIFPVDYIKKYIDYIALHKMNYFHWHLTDDQGWRMESKAHPLLNEKSAYRDGTIIGIFPGTGVDSTRYGGYYTIEQMKEIVDYAAKRYITVVPEIDIPGHCMAVLAAYPEFGTEPEKVTKPAITWGIYNRQNNVLAPSEEVFKFLEDVFNELMDVFPGKYIHMGADECAHKWWKESPEVQQFIKDHNLKNEKGLQRYFAKRVSDVIKARGRVAVGWDEMVDNKLIEDVVVMSWRGVSGAHRAAKQGHKAILTPQALSYFNRQQRADEDSLAHRGPAVSIDKVYKFNPLPDSLSAFQKSNIIGGQGCMWTEYYPTVRNVEYAIFPRMSAIAEVYWSDPKVKNWPKFLLKLPVQFDRYDLWGANYSDFVFEYECFPRK